MTYNFYFDESFHSRKITSKSFKDTDYFNSYISVGIGFKHYKLEKISKKYSSIERIYKNKYALAKEDELKSGIVSKVHYKYGISTFNNIEVQLYSDFFSFLIKENIIYYISICDKLEYLLLQCKYDAPPIFNIRACIYSIVKLINVYRPKDIIIDILNSSNNLIKDLKKFCKNQLKENQNLKLKELENEAIQNILIFLNYIDTTNINYEFDYDFTYRGLTYLIDEMKEKTDNVIIDEEGTDRIYNCARKYFASVSQINSKSCECVRISDMLCGFISKMMRALYDDIKNDPSIPYKEQHLFSIRWFNLSKEKFDLYKSVIKYIKKYKSYYYGSYISTYFDLFSVLMGLLYYFDKYSSYDDYRKKSNNDHCDLANEFIKERVMGDIMRMEISY